MPPSEVDQLRTHLNHLQHSMSEGLNGVRTDLKELAKAMRELIRMDGDLKRQNDLIMRIGKQVDDLEKRTRVLEISVPVNAKGIEHSAWANNLLFTVGGSLITGLLLWVIR